MEVQLRRLGSLPQFKVLPLGDKDYIWTAGRGSNCDIYTVSRFASRTHFSIIYRDKRFYIVDHGSFNGTFLNDKKIHSQKEYPLPLNSIISVGVLSMYQNERDCLVLSFELCKGKQDTGELKHHTDEEDTNSSALKESPIERVSLKTKPDEKLQVVQEKPACNLPTSSEALTGDKITTTRPSASTGKDNSDSVKRLQEENISAVKSDLVPEVLCSNNLIANQTDLVVVEKGTLQGRSASTNSNTAAVDTEVDLFERKCFADDEVVHGFGDQTEVDEPLNRKYQSSYSTADEIIEISDTEDHDDVSIYKMGNFEVLKPNPTSLNSYEGGACTDKIKSNTENHHLVTEMIVVDDDNAYPETDKKWFGKLLKTEENLCLSVQSRRENPKDLEHEKSDDDWMEYVAESAERIGQILVTEDVEENEIEIIQVGSGKGNTTVPDNNVPLGLIHSDNKTSPVKQEADPAKSETCSTSALKKRSPISSSDRETSGNSKRMKQFDSNELVNYIIPRLGTHIPARSESQFSDQQPELPNLRVSKPVAPKRSTKRTPRKTKRGERLPVSEKQMIIDNRRKKLREISLRQTPKEHQMAMAPKGLPPVKVKITEKNRSEYLCHPTSKGKNSELHSEKFSGEPDEAKGGKSEFTVEKGEHIAENRVGIICPVEEKLQVQHLCTGETAGNGIYKEIELPDKLPLDEVENHENVELIVKDVSGRNLKSCLKKYGYSFMRSNEPIAPLKTVRFGIIPRVEVNEVENKITKKTSSILQCNVKNKESEVQPRNAIADICSWNARWLKECKSATVSELPPAFHQLENAKWKYPNHENYIKTFVPLLLLDLWQTISSIWKVSNSGMYRFPAVFISEVEMLENKNSGLRRIKCEGLAEVSPGVLYSVREGDLVMIHLKVAPVVSDNEKMTGRKPNNLVCRIFGYVDQKTRVNVTPNQIHPSLLQQYSFLQPNKSIQLLSLEILITNRLKMIINPSSLLQITGVYHVEPQLVQCQAVYQLPLSPLSQSILSPKIANLALPRSQSNENITFSGPLDDIQRQLVLNLVSSCINRDHNLLQIQGGPGTGKTHLIVAFILQLLFTKQWKENSRPIILYCAHSNIVVDDMALKLKNYRNTLSRESKYKLVRFGRFNAMKSTVRDVSNYSLGLKNDHLMQIANKTRALDEKIKVLVAELESSNLLSKDEIDEKSSQLHTYVKQRQCLKDSKPVYLPGQKPSYSSESFMLENADIICTTCLDCGSKIMLNAFRRIKAKNPSRKIICILDEAMQIKETETIVPLLLGVTHLILFGDSRQLKSFPRCELTQSLGLYQSLFWRILGLFKNIRDDLSPIVTLKTQYRMNSAILAFSNKFFYNNNLKDGSVNQNRYNINDYLVLVDKLSANSETSFKIRLYIIAMKVISVLLNIMANNITDNSFGIITCGHEHSNNLKAALSQTLERNVFSKIEVNPIENVQGQEFDVVLFILDPHMDYSALANVALTRAKHSLIILTSTSVYSKNKFLKKLLEEAVIRGACFYINTFTEGKLLRSIISKNTVNSC